MEQTEHQILIQLFNSNRRVTTTWKNQFGTICVLTHMNKANVGGIRHEAFDKKTTQLSTYRRDEGLKSEMVWNSAQIVRPPYREFSNFSTLHQAFTSFRQKDTEDCLRTACFGQCWKRTQGMFSHVATHVKALTEALITAPSCAWKRCRGAGSLNTGMPRIRLPCPTQARRDLWANGCQRRARLRRRWISGIRAWTASSRCASSSSSSPRPSASVSASRWKIRRRGWLAPGRRHRARGGSRWRSRTCRSRPCCGRLDAGPGTAGCRLSTRWCPSKRRTRSADGPVRTACTGQPRAPSTRCTPHCSRGTDSCPQYSHRTPAPPHTARFRLPSTR